MQHSELYNQQHMCIVMHDMPHYTMLIIHDIDDMVVNSFAAKINMFLSLPHSPKPVQAHPLADLAGAAKVHDANGRPLWVAEQDVLRFEVAVDDLCVGRGEEEQRCAQLLGKLAREIEGDPAKVCVAQEFVEVVREQLKHEAEVVAKHEVALEPYWRRAEVKEEIRRKEGNLLHTQVLKIKNRV